MSLKSLSNLDKNTRMLRLSLEVKGPLDLESTLECGQAFRWNKAVGTDGFTWYKGVVGPWSVMVRYDHQASELLVQSEVSDEVLNGTQEQLSEKLSADVFHYFSLDDDLGRINDYFVEQSVKIQKAPDPVISAAALASEGLRILRQDPWECLVSYIVSTNKNIPAIRNIVGKFCNNLGPAIAAGQHVFPAPDAFVSAGHDCIKEFRCGFRAAYVFDAASKVVKGEVDLEGLGSLPTSKAKETLMQIKGVGPKVADCVLLFAYHRLEVFPVDVWVARAMSHFYFEGREITVKEAREEGIRRFGEFAGYAQEYLFHYCRNVLKGRI